MKRDYAEQRLQIAARDLFNVAYPGLFWYAVPNGGSRDKREAALLKATGVRPGVPDLAFVLDDGSAAFIELKSPTGKLSPDQVAVHAILRGKGARVAVCRSIDDLIETMAAWRVPSIARAA